MKLCITDVSTDHPSPAIHLHTIVVITKNLKMSKLAMSRPKAQTEIVIQLLSP